MDASTLAQIVENLRKIGTDTSTIEVKAASGGCPKSIDATISAFANGAGGLIILGLDETAGFSTVPRFDARRCADAFASRCVHHMDPPVRADIEILSFDDREVVIASIPAFQPFDKPCYVKEKGRYNGSYIRTADGDRRLTFYEVDRLLEQKQQPQWDREAVDEATVEDLDATLVQKVLERERELHERSKTADDATLRRRLNITRMVEGREVPTVAGLVALGDYPQQFFPQLMVSFAVYPGDTKASVTPGVRMLDNVTFVGPIPDMIDEGVRAVLRNSRRGAVIKGVHRFDLPDYAEGAVREALTNALMHRDYSPTARGAQVMIDMYPDRLEITNPGGLFGTVTLDALGTDGVSSSRNQALSTLLELTPARNGGFVAENRGSGYVEILSEQQRAHLPAPHPDDQLSRFRLTFARRYLTEIEGGGAMPATPRELILDHLRHHATAASKELATVAGVSVGRVRQILNELCDSGEVERTQPARSPKQRYRIATTAQKQRDNSKNLEHNN